MAGRDIGRSCVDIFAVHLIGEEIQVVFLDQITDLVHLAAGIEITCRVVRVADHDGTGALVDQLLELLHLRQRETFLDGGGDGTNLGTRRDGEGHIVGICRLWHDDLITWVQTRKEGEEYRLTSSRGDDDVISSDIDIVLGVVVYQFLAVALIALRR